ncbi:hypothetical protein M422DRAFT_48191 [Sphaerobolus stellatus SS14]|uniref:Uncharacterized protein n=1 Tax=Sphaerobolus stellatus (strain SS14) TaxID=990650 RepID=A0A0C9VW86_SPHS4|nr:hypothetical protein M422DRAFT_48191 [Sphaerobolus stellatus SS14]
MYAIIHASDLSPIKFASVINCTLFYCIVSKPLNLHFRRLRGKLCFWGASKASKPDFPRQSRIYLLQALLPNKSSSYKTWGMNGVNTVFSQPLSDLEAYDYTSKLSQPGSEQQEGTLSGLYIPLAHSQMEATIAGRPLLMDPMEWEREQSQKSINA